MSRTATRRRRFRMGSVSPSPYLTGRSAFAASTIAIARTALTALTHLAPFGLQEAASSTDKQTTSNQLPDLMRYVEFHKWNVVETYIDEDVSGKKISRPAFDRMMLDAHLNKFDVVLVVRLDRLSRSVKHLLSTLEVLDKLGIGFASVTQNIDTTTAAGKLLFTILGAMAEFESTLISERTKAGLARVRKDGSKSGRRIGRPTRDICALKLTQMRSQGMSARRIALELNVPLTTLHRRLA